VTAFRLLFRVYPIENITIYIEIYVAFIFDVSNNSSKKRGKLHIEIITFSTVRVIEKRWEEGHGIMINNLK